MHLLWGSVTFFPQALFFLIRCSLAACVSRSVMQCGMVQWEDNQEAGFPLLSATPLHPEEDWGTHGRGREPVEQEECQITF